MPIVLEDFTETNPTVRSLSCILPVDVFTVVDINDSRHKAIQPTEH